jgi:hypothetical protein
MMDKVKDSLGVGMNFTNALDHGPEAERNNRTIKEWVWAAVCGILGSGEQTRIESCIIRIPESMVESHYSSPK